VQGGKVRLNDARAKPAKVLEIGDELRIQRGEETWVVHVESLSDRRGPASEARKLYRETEESRIQREAQAERRKAERAAMGDRDRRPDKRQRRQIIRFRKERDG
jgi:ribosome-associated heat shock protein Hsp15